MPSLIFRSRIYEQTCFNVYYLPVLQETAKQLRVIHEAKTRCQDHNLRAQTANSVTSIKVDRVNRLVRTVHVQPEHGMERDHM